MSSLWVEESIRAIWDQTESLIARSRTNGSGKLDKLGCLSGLVEEETCGALQREGGVRCLNGSSDLCSEGYKISYERHARSFITDRTVPINRSRRKPNSSLGTRSFARYTLLYAPSISHRSLQRRSVEALPPLKVLADPQVI